MVIEREAVRAISRDEGGGSSSLADLRPSQRRMLLDHPWRRVGSWRNGRGRVEAGTAGGTRTRRVSDRLFSLATATYVQLGRQAHSPTRTILYCACRSLLSLYVRICPTLLRL